MAHEFQEGKRPRWSLETRVLEENRRKSRRDYFGYAEASIEEIQLLRAWTEHCIDGTYPIDNRGYYTLLMDFSRPKSEWSRDYLIGTIYPGSYGWGKAPRNEPLPDEMQAD